MNAEWPLLRRWRLLARREANMAGGNSWSRHREELPFVSVGVLVNKVLAVGLSTVV